MDGKQQELSADRRLSTDCNNPADPLLSSDHNKQAEFFDMVRQLKDSLEAKTSECASLKIRLAESDREVEVLSSQVNLHKTIMLQSQEGRDKFNEELFKLRKLQEDYVKLMSSYLNLEEQFEQQRRFLHDSYLTKTNALNNYEGIMGREIILNELEKCKLELNQKQADLCLAMAKLRNMDEEKSTREKYISELKKSLDDAKVTHKHEITVLEEYIQCLKNTIISYEKTLANYAAADASITMGSKDAVKEDDNCDDDPKMEGDTTATAIAAGGST